MCFTTSSCRVDLDQNLDMIILIVGQSFKTLFLHLVDLNLGSDHTGWFQNTCLNDGQRLTIGYCFYDFLEVAFNVR